MNLIKTELTEYTLTTCLIAYWNAWTCYCGMCWDKGQKISYLDILNQLDSSRFTNLKIPSYQA